MPQANAIAFLVLVFWPVAVWFLYQRMERRAALVWAILGGYMLLPPAIAIDLPLVPDFNKYSIPSLAAAAAVVFLLKERFSLWPENTAARVLIVIFTLSPFATVLTNGDPIYYLQAVIPAMRIYDSLSVVVAQAIALLPFFLGRKYLADAEGQRVIVVALVVAGLIYSLPMLFEARMSPQLNVLLYGYFQHDFSQAIRFGGFRPFVFMPHGLWVAFFAFMCLAAAAALLRQGPAAARPWQLGVMLYLAVVLIFCRSMGPIFYALLLLPMILFLPRKVQVLVAALMAAVVVTYPLLRGLHVVPIDDVLRFASSINAERGASLAFRINAEEVLLVRAEERPWFGWGGYGRSMLHDPVTGRISVIADGGWIIILGTYGWLGYISQFGLLALPLFLLIREAWAVQSGTLTPWVGVLALILAANLFDLLPNDTIIPFTWLLAGAMLGHAEALAAARRKAARAAFEAEFPSGRTIL
ncbi:MAG: hypothetical protein MUF74_04645 [Cypionkella sp.]|nr:hypothetical protein [Cypionkella sp.]